jgi:hypothetical protein
MKVLLHSWIDAPGVPLVELLRAPPILICGAGCEPLSPFRDSAHVSRYLRIRRPAAVLGTSATAAGGSNRREKQGELRASRLGSVYQCLRNE